MTAVPDSERRTRYSPVVPTARFNVGFIIFDADDLTVFIDGVERAQGDLDYPWTVEATFTAGESATAQVVADGAGWSGVTVDIVGKIAPSRINQFIDGRGIPADNWNLIHNWIAAALRERYDRSTRQLVAAFGETIDPLPVAAVRANMALTFDADGQPTVGDLVGDTGWSPVFAVVSDGTRRVLQLTGYVGGEGTAPTDHVGEYVGATAMVALVANGVDIRGAQGASGAGTGDMLAAQNLADLVSAATARTNLGLGALAVLSTISAALLDALSVTTAKIADAAVTAIKIAAGAVANSAMADMLAGRIKARGTASTGAPEDIPVGVNLVLDATSLRSDKTTVVTKTDSHTLELADAGKVVEMNKATANILTVPPNSSVAFPVGTWINPSQIGAGQTTIAAGVGVTVLGRTGLKLAGQYALATLYKRGTDEWIAGGDLTS